MTFAACTARLALVVLLTGLPWSARAHDTASSFILLDIGRSVVDVELQAPVKDIGPRADEYALTHLHLLTPSGQRYSAQLQSVAVRAPDGISPIRTDRFIVRVRMQPPPDTSTQNFTVDYTAPTHDAHSLVLIRRDIRNGMIGEGRIIVGRIGDRQTRIGVDSSQGSWWHGFAQLFALGVHHIATGFDHLLFLLVLLLPAPLIASNGRWMPGKSVRESSWTIARTVSGFTVGHSLTLAFAALGWVTVPSRPVEVLIAASIIVSAIHAWRPVFAGREIWLASGFGLVHGLAFASTLGGLSFDPWTLGISLLGFNLGIEAMQLLVVAAVLPLLILASRTPVATAIRISGATLGTICALGWIGERAFNLPNPIAPSARSEYRQPLVAQEPEGRCSIG